MEKLIAQMIEAGVFFQDAVSEFEKKYIRAVLDLSDGNQSRAAKTLGMHRNTLGRKIEQYHLASKNGGSRQRSATNRRKPRAK